MSISEKQTFHTANFGIKKKVHSGDNSKKNSDLKRGRASMETGSKHPNTQTQNNT